MRLGRLPPHRSNLPIARTDGRNESETHSGWAVNRSRIIFQCNDALLPHKEKPAQLGGDELLFAGEGSRPHFVGMALGVRDRLELTRLPYKGGPAALQDLLSGQVAAAVIHVQAGRLSALLISAPQPNPLGTSVPTALEAAFPRSKMEE